MVDEAEHRQPYRLGGRSAGRGETCGERSRPTVGQYEIQPRIGQRDGFLPGRDSASAKARSRARQSGDGGQPMQFGHGITQARLEMPSLVAAAQSFTVRRLDMDGGIIRYPLIKPLNMP